MDTLLLFIIIVLLFIDLEARAVYRSMGGVQVFEQPTFTNGTTQAESQLRSLTDEAILALVYEAQQQPVDRPVIKQRTQGVGRPSKGQS